MLGFSSIGGQSIGSSQSSDFGAAGSVLAKAGSFTLNSVNGIQQITGTGFTPKVAIMWAYQITVQGGANEIRSCFGAATSSTSRWASAMSHRGSVGYRSMRLRSDVLLFWNDALTDAEQMAFNLSTMDSDGFSINVTNGEPNVVVNYLVLGGSGVDAKTGTFNSPTLVGAQTVSGVGFQPKALIAMTGPYNTTEVASTTAAHCLGMATGTSQYFSQAFTFLNDGLSQAFSKLGSDRRFIEQIGPDGVSQSRATVTSMSSASAVSTYLEADPVGAWDDSSRFASYGLVSAMGQDQSISVIPNATGKVGYLSSATSNAVTYPISIVLTTGVPITNVNFRGRARQTLRYMGTETWKCVSLRFRDINDGSNYYNVRFGPFGWEFTKRVAGVDTVIASGTSVKNILGNWFSFAIEHIAASGLITIALDGTLVYSGIDYTFLDGAVGFAIEYGEMEFDSVTGNVTDNLESYAVGTRPQYTTVGSWLGAWMSNGEPGAVWGIRTGGIVDLLGNSEDGLTNLTKVADPVIGASRLAFRFRVAQRDAITYGTEQGPVVAPATGLSVLTDNFDDNSTDSAKWTIGTNISGVNPAPVTVAETGGALSITVPSGVGLAYSGYLSANTYDLTGSGAFVRVSQVPTTPSYIETYMMVGTDNNNGLFIVQAGGTLYFQHKVGGTVTTVSTVSYNATTHAWWRIREANGTIYWDTAPASTEGTRDAYLQPFASTSIWNTPIGSGAIYASAGSTVTTWPPVETGTPTGTALTPRAIPATEFLFSTYGGVPGASLATLQTAFANAFAAIKSNGGGTLTIGAGTYDFGSTSVNTTFISVDNLVNTRIVATGALFRCNSTAVITPNMFVFNNPDNVTIDGMSFKDLGGDPNVNWRGAICLIVQCTSAHTDFRTRNCSADTVTTFFQSQQNINQYTFEGFDIEGTVTNSYYGCNPNYNGRYSRAKLTTTNIRRAFIGYGVQHWDITVDHTYTSGPGSNALISLSPKLGYPIDDNTVRLTARGGLNAYNALVSFYHQSAANEVGYATNNNVLFHMDAPTSSASLGIVCFTAEPPGTGAIQTSTISKWQDITVNGTFNGSYSGAVVANPSVSSATDNRIYISDTLSSRVNLASLPSYFSFVTITSGVSQGGLTGTPRPGESVMMPYGDDDHIVMKPNAPMTSVNYSSVAFGGGNRCTATGGLMTTVPLPSNYLVPSSTGHDSLCAVLPDHVTLVEGQPFSRCVAGNAGTIATVSSPNQSITGDGILGGRGGSGMSVLGGTLRIGELRPGQQGPRHALKVNVYAKQALFKATTGAEAYRWPAAHGDSYAVGWYGTETVGSTSAGSNTNTNMKMGALLAIAASVDLAALGLETEPARQLAWTLQNYGAYIVDDTYTPGFAFSTEDSPNGNFRAQFLADYGYTFNQNELSADTAWRRDVKRLVQSLSVVANNSATSIGGGGTPRQPLAAPLANVANPPAESQWVNRASVAAPLTITSFRAHLAAGCYSSLASPVTVLYDGFNTGNAASTKPKRTELVWPGLDKGLSVGTAYWHAFRINVGTSIRSAASTESVILFQHQDGSGIERSIAPLALYATGGGASAKLQIKTAWLDGGSTPTQSTVYDATYAADTWITFVIKVKPSYQLSDTPYLKVWRDGTLVVDDLLRNDFNNGQVTYGAKRSFVRFGLMHPDDTQWAAGDSRDVYHKGLITLVDDGTQTEASMRDLIENVVGNPTAGTADGWTMYWDAVPAASGKIGYVALGGAAQYQARVLTKPTTTGSQTVSLGFEPAGMLFGTIGTAISANAAQNIKWAIGAASSTSKTAVGFYEPDNSSSVALPVATQSSTRALIIPGTTSGVTLAEMDMTALGVDGYTINWTKVDPIAAEVLSLAIGTSTLLRSDVLCKTTITADLTTTVRMSAAATAKTTITAALTAPGGGLRATLLCAATLTAALTTLPRMAAAVSAKTTISASLSTAIRMAAAASAKTTISASLNGVPGNLRASATAKTTVTADLLAQIMLKADLTARTTITAALATTTLMSAAATTRTTILANLTAPSDVVSTLSFSDWLESDTTHRCVLVEAAPKVGGVTVNRYLSSKAYATSKYEFPASTHYDALLTGGIKVTERLSIDGINSGSAGMSFGDIEIRNANGELDSWLNDVWANTPVKVYVGDVTWPRSKFQKVFDGLASDIDSKSRTMLNIKVRDKLDRLNNPAYETKLGGTTVNKDKVLPLSLGEVHNMTPLLIDPATHTYRVHPTTIEDIIEVRDNGVPVSITKNTPDGTFSLMTYPEGTITASVQGDKAGGIYANDMANLVLRLVRLYGRTEYRFLDSEIDYVNFNAFGAAYTMPVGTLVEDHSNILQICQNFLSSVGAQLTVSRLGLLQIKTVDFTLASTFSITPEDMLEKRLEIAARSTVIAADKVGFCRNWTVQSDLQTGIVEEHKALYAEEWLTETAIDTAVADAYKLNTEPQQRNTMLLRRIDATAEANRRLDILKVPRTTYRFDGLPRMLQLTTGQNVTLTHPRFGLSSGKVGVVTSLSPDWGNCRVQVEITV